MDLRSLVLSVDGNCVIEVYSADSKEFLTYFDSWDADNKYLDYDVISITSAIQDGKAIIIAYVD